MYKLLIISKNTEKARRLSFELTRKDFSCMVAGSVEDVARDINKQDIDLALIDIDGSPDSTLAESGWGQLRDIIPRRQLPTIALISREIVDSIDSNQSIDDFVVEPYDLSELVTRTKRTLRRLKNSNGKGLIVRGDLVIDTLRCEVSINGRLIVLTFKEYELLKFLAANSGIVFSRDTLLNEVWGYDYYGGDRTVDVTIRRLRSKIEDSNHSFIETVRNIGYKFRDEA